MGPKAGQSVMRCDIEAKPFPEAVNAAERWVCIECATRPRIRSMPGIGPAATWPLVGPSGRT